METIVLRFCCSSFIRSGSEAKKKGALRLFHQPQNLSGTGNPQNLRKTYQSAVLYDPSWASLAIKKNHLDEHLFSDD
jgi:hypothetical protein